MAPPPPPPLRLPLLLLLLLMGGAELRPPAATHALPIVDPGLFVIMGVKTCRAGTGYCLLGNDCTLDEDFLPDDRNGHCDGLRSAFTPSAHFVCCRYSAETNVTTDLPAATTHLPAAAATTDRPAATTEDASLDTTTQVDADAATTQTETYSDENAFTTDVVEHRATEQNLEETTTEAVEGTSTLRVEDEESISDEKKTNESNYVKRTRIDLGEEQRAFTELSGFTVTEITTNPSTDVVQDSRSTTKPGEDSMSSSSEHVNKINSESEDGKKHDSNVDIENHNNADENKNSIYSYTSNGVMMHDILKLITEGEWQISFKNNEVTDEENSDVTTDENFTESLPLSTSYNDQTESTMVPDEEYTGISNRQNPEMTESSNEATTLTNTEEYVRETTLNPITTAFNDRESSTIPIQTDLGIETEVIVKDKVGQENSTKETSESTTTASSNGENSTDVSSPATSNDTSEESDSQPRLCLGDGIREDSCWLVRFIDERFDSFICHGAMIGHNLILTSAVCAISLYQAGTSNVQVGSSSSDKSNMKVESIAIHEDYRPRAVDSSRNDLGLISVTSRNACSVCMATPNLELKPATCYTFASTSQGDGDVKRYQCEEVNVQEDDHHSVKCTLPERENLQVQSGAPLVCSGSVAGVAFSSARGAPSFTPAAHLLPWVRWNLKRLRTRGAPARH